MSSPINNMDNICYCKYCNSMNDGGLWSMGAVIFVSAEKRRRDDIDDGSSRNHIVKIILIEPHP